VTGSYQWGKDAINLNYKYFKSMVLYTGMEGTDSITVPMVKKCLNGDVFFRRVLQGETN
jgi:hypothetical protein